MREKVTRIVNDQISGGWADLHAYSSLIAPFLTSIQFHHNIIIIIIVGKGIVVYLRTTCPARFFLQQNMQYAVSFINLYYVAILGKWGGSQVAIQQTHSRGVGESHL